MNKVIATILVLFLCLSVAACGSDKASVEGKWVVKEVDISDSALISDLEKNALKLGYKKMVLNLNEDGKGIMTYIGEDTEITWEVKDEHTVGIYIGHVLYKNLDYYDGELVMSFDTDKYFLSVKFEK